MSTVRQYVAKLPDDEKVLIMANYEQYEKDGWIGDEPIRRHAQAFIEQVNASESGIIMWMNAMAFECFRYFAYKGLGLGVNI